MRKLSTEILLRYAAMDSEDQPLEEGLSERDDFAAHNLFPRSILDRLRRIFTPRGLPFFQFYELLKRIELGEPAPEDLKRQYIIVANKIGQVTSPVDGRSLSPTVINLIAESRTSLSLYFGRLVAGNTNDNQTWMKINTILVPIYLEAAKDKGLYLTALQRGNRKWTTFRKMGDRQEADEKLRDVNPEAYKLVKKYKKTLAEIDESIQRRVERMGYQVSKGFLAGRQVIYAVDPETQEKMVCDLDGDVLSPQEYVAKRRAHEEAEKKLTLGGGRTDVHPSELRSLTDEEMQQHLIGKPEMVSMTDDKAKQGRLTRLYQVRLFPKVIDTVNDQGDVEERVTAVRVITSGRYKGIFLDDMVNATGRMIEGTSYTFSAVTGRSFKMPKRIDPAIREPYVSVAEVEETLDLDGTPVTQKRTRLFLKIPGERSYKTVRDAVKSLACNSSSAYSKKGCITSIEMHPVTGTNAVGFYFDEKDFNAVMEATQGMSLSTAALELVQEYYTDLARAEAATARHNLGNYTADAIGGFKTAKKVRTDEGGVEMRAVTLSTKQKQALAWLDANGNKGVCGLDTGVGKTLTAIAAMQKMIRDGLAEEDGSYTTPAGKTVTTNGRFLYVCPTTLKGNLPKEMRAFLSEAGLLIDKTDVVSYREFKGASNSRKVPRSIKSVDFWQGRDWDPALYVAVFFDEAQELLSTSKKTPAALAEHALRLWHPRKICMTASPIERNPMEAFILGCVCNNMPLNGDDPKARSNSKEMRKFKERFCEVVGDRIVGVKQEPTIKRDLDVWVRRNIYYADKQDVDVEAGEKPLSKLRSGTVAITMDPVVEQIYRGVVKQFPKAMAGMAAKFRDKQNTALTNNPEIEDLLTVNSDLAPVLKLMNDLSNYPNLALREVADMMEFGRYTTAKGRVGPIPRALVPIVAAWKAKIGPDQIRDRAEKVGNPKLEMTKQTIAARMERSNGASRTILFSDDRKMCEMAARHMANTIPGLHVVALDDSISIYDGGTKLDAVRLPLDADLVRKLVKDPALADSILAQKVSVIPLPFKKKAYRKYPMLPAESGNVVYRADNWQQFALNEIVSPNPDVKTLTLLGQSYQYGHNLQAFDTVIHLDRDTWNSESMKQRTARSWRQGQRKPVTELTLDTTYRESSDSFDNTLDQIQRMFQKMEADVFNVIIKGAQSIALGTEWSGMTKEHASVLKLDRKMLELAASPYSGRSIPPGE